MPTTPARRGGRIRARRGLACRRDAGRDRRARPRRRSRTRRAGSSSATSLRPTGGVPLRWVPAAEPARVAVPLRDRPARPAAPDHRDRRRRRGVLGDRPLARRVARATVADRPARVALPGLAVPARLARPRGGGSRDGCARACARGGSSTAACTRSRLDDRWLSRARAAAGTRRRASRSRRRGSRSPARRAWPRSVDRDGSPGLATEPPRALGRRARRPLVSARRLAGWRAGRWVARLLWPRSGAIDGCASRRETWRRDRRTQSPTPSSATLVRGVRLVFLAAAELHRRGRLDPRRAAAARDRARDRRRRRRRDVVPAPRREPPRSLRAVPQRSLRPVRRPRPGPLRGGSHAEGLDEARVVADRDDRPALGREACDHSVDDGRAPGGRARSSARRGRRPAFASRARRRSRAAGGSTGRGRTGLRPAAPRGRRRPGSPRPRPSSSRPAQAERSAPRTRPRRGTSARTAARPGPGTSARPARAARRDVADRSVVPAIETRPAVGRSRPFQCRTSVDLPEPLRPTIATRSPVSIERSTPRARGCRRDSGNGRPGSG